MRAASTTRTGHHHRHLPVPCGQGGGGLCHGLRRQRRSVACRGASTGRHGHGRTQGEGNSEDPRKSWTRIRGTIGTRPVRMGAAVATDSVPSGFRLKTRTLIASTAPGSSPLPRATFQVASSWRAWPGRVAAAPARPLEWPMRVVRHRETRIFRPAARVTGRGCRGEVCARTPPPDVCSCRLQS